MIIRQEQLASLSTAARTKFEDRVAEHLKRCFPKQCEELGEAGIQNLIDSGIHQAAKHEIILERDVCKFIDLMVAFGRAFDHDPALPWASEILEDETFHNATARVERLFEKA